MAKKSRKVCDCDIREFEDPDDSAISENDSQYNDDDIIDPPSNITRFKPTKATPVRTVAASEPVERIRDIKRQVEAYIFSRSKGFATAKAQGDYSGVRNLVGVGVGVSDFRKLQSISEEGPGSPVLNIYVAEPMDMDAVRRSMFDRIRVSAATDDRIPINIHYSGPIDAYSHRHRDRASPCGISIGDESITAGTLGCLARGTDKERSKRILLLSNNHVIAGSNLGEYGDPILQPGSYDGGRSPDDCIAVLENSITIDFDGEDNYVDAATGWCWKDRVRPEFIFRTADGWKYFRISNEPVDPHIGMPVGKSGRKSQLTMGRVVDVEASINVNYSQGRVAKYVDQIVIEGVNEAFSANGDSGSLIWTYNEKRAPVALLFAGGRGYTFANKIGHVMDALKIVLWT